MTANNGNNSPWSLFQALIAKFRGDQSAINPFADKWREQLPGRFTVEQFQKPPTSATPSPWDQFGASEDSSPFDILNADPNTIDTQSVNQYGNIYGQQQSIYEKGKLPEPTLPNMNMPTFSPESLQLPPTTNNAPDLSLTRQDRTSIAGQPMNQDVNIDVNAFPDKYKDKLPFGAIKWNLDGTPNYGDGIPGWFNEWSAKIYAPKMVESNGRYTEQPPSTIDKYLRSGGYVVGSFFDAFFTDPQLYLYEKAADMTTAKQLARYAETGSIYYDRALFEEAGDWALALIPPLYDSYNRAFKEKIRTGIYTIDQDQINQLTAVNQIWFKRNFGTGVRDASLYQEYLRSAMSEDTEEFRWGQDKLKTPQELAKKYEDGGANLAAQMIFDPTNFLDMAITGSWKFIGKLKQLKGIPEVVKVISGGEKSLEAYRAALKSGDEVVKLVELDTLRDLIFRNAGTALGRNKITNNLFQLSAAAHQTRLYKKVEYVLLPLIASLKETPTLITDVLFDIAKIGSRNVDDIEIGLRELYKANPHIVQLFYTEGGQEVARFMNNVVEKFPVIFSESALRTFAGGDSEKIMAHIADVFDTAVKELYPNILEIADNQKLLKEIVDTAAAKGVVANIPDALKRFADIELSPAAVQVLRYHDMLQKAGFSSLARTFGTIFIMGNPGSWVRNFEQNLVHAIVDSGPDVVGELFNGLKDADALNKLYGFKVTSVKGGFGAYGTGLDGKLTGNIFGKIGNAIQGAYSWGEDTVRMAIELNETKRTLRTFLKPGAAIPEYDDLRAANITEPELERLTQLMKDNWGDPDKAIKQFLLEKGTSGVEHFRNIAVILPQKMLNIVRNIPQFEQEIEEALSVAKSPTMEDAVKNLAAIAQKYIDKAADGELVQYASFFDEESLQHPFTQAILQSVPSQYVGREMDLLWNKAVVRDTIFEKITRGVTMILHDKLGKSDARKFVAAFFDAVGEKTLNTGSLDPDSVLLSRGDRMATVRVFQEQVNTDARKINDMITETGVTDAVITALNNLPDFAKYTNGITINTSTSPKIVKTIMWDIYYKPYLNDLFVDSTKRVIGVMTQIFSDVATATGKDLRGFKEVTKLFADINLYGRILDAKSLAEGKLIINDVEKLVKGGNIVDALKTIAYRAGIPISNVDGISSEDLLRFINENIPDMVSDTSRAVSGAAEDVVGAVAGNVDTAAGAAPEVSTVVDSAPDVIPFNTDYLTESADSSSWSDTLRLMGIQVKRGFKKAVEGLASKTAKFNPYNDAAEGFYPIDWNAEDSLTLQNYINYIAKGARIEPDAPKEWNDLVRSAFKMAPDVDSIYPHLLEPSVYRAQLEDAFDTLNRLRNGAEGSAPVVREAASTVTENIPPVAQAAAASSDTAQSVSSAAEAGADALKSVPKTKSVAGRGVGRGTALGDEKDVAMRLASNSAIVELASQKPSSSLTTLTQLGNPVGDLSGTTIMLARNGELKNTPLKEVTIEAIKDAAAAGAKFVVGDMPGVDDEFFKLLDEIGADYTVYHVGAKPRATVRTAPVVEAVVSAVEDAASSPIGAAASASSTPMIPNPVSAYARLSDIPLEDGLRAINKWLIAQGKEPIALEMFNRILKGAPHLTGRPTYAQAVSENLPGYLKTIQATIDGVRSTWGSSKYTGAHTVEQAAGLAKWAEEAKKRMALAKSYALAQAQRMADFSLLDYNDKRGFDAALQYFMPYQFWYTRSYKNWAVRLAQNPALANKFMDYQRWLYDYNEGQPDYLRGQVDIGSLLHMENPLFFNLMASFNPLNSVTGVDYTDPKKIVGKPGSFEYTMTNLLDTVGKFGPSVSPLFQWSLAAYLANIGEKDAAARWAGRMLPQSAVFKAVASQFNMNIDIDPMVQIFSQGAGGDPNEINRAARAMRMIVDSGGATMNEAIEAVRTKKGPLWEQAMILATKDRMISTIGGSLFGLGMKYQTVNDQEIANMFDESSKFWSNSDSYTAEEKAYFSLEMQKKYPAYDLVVIGQKRGLDQMKVYGFSVLSRIPPNQLTPIANLLLPDKGNDLLEQFWNTGGNMYDLNELDRDKLMTAFIELGQLLDMPDGATQKEWTNVQILYSRLNDNVTEKYGKDVELYMTTYYDLMKTDNRAADAYAEANPVVLDAIDYKNSVILQTPLLAKYYASVSKAERYWDNRWSDVVKEKIHPDYFTIAHERDLFNDPEAKKAYEKAVGWEALSKKYNAMHSEYLKQINFKKLDLDNFLSMQEYGWKLSESPPEDLSVGQTAVMELFTQNDMTVERMKTLDWTKVVDTGHVLPEYEKEFFKWVNNPSYVLSGPANGQISALMSLMNDLDPETGYTRDDMIFMIRNYYGQGR